MLVGTGQLLELETAPFEIGYHLVAEVLTALVLVLSGVGVLRAGRVAGRLYPIALGMLGYTVVNSAGYDAERGEWLVVGMFAALTLASVVLIGEYLTDTPSSSRR